MKEYKESKKAICITITLWVNLVIGLLIRGKCCRESGAFLLGSWSGECGRVSRIVFYDKLDPNVYKNGIIEFHGTGQAKLWEICRTNNLQVVADCHTHPTINTDQSDVDKQNPMVPMKGHIALIIPKFAKILPWKTNSVGIHEYIGNYRWKKYQFNNINLIYNIMRIKQ